MFVLRDGGEVDLDLGNYERYLNIELSRDHNASFLAFSYIYNKRANVKQITTGKIYKVSSPAL